MEATRLMIDAPGWNLAQDVGALVEVGQVSKPPLRRTSVGSPVGS
jgi:hypothetical protein